MCVPFAARIDDQPIEGEITAAKGTQKYLLAVDLSASTLSGYRQSSQSVTEREKLLPVGSEIPSALNVFCTPDETISGEGHFKASLHTKPAL